MIDHHSIDMVLSENCTKRRRGYRVGTACGSGRL